MSEPKGTTTYNHQQVEEKWLNKWQEDGLLQGEMKQFVQKEQDGQELDPMYLLFAFAYPSGSGLHVGHVESITALDIMARYYRMSGKDVFFPVGWDAFGLPAENYAIKTGVPPAQTTQEAIDTFSRQVKRVAISYDWQTEVATCHPEYYRWTQWLFKQFFNENLAYKDTGVVNWCPSCQTVLANEQVVEGLCERCDHKVVQKELEQWYFKITVYKDEIIAGLDEVDWPKATKQQQRNWIGKSKGVNVDFELAVRTDKKVKKVNQTLTCFTTRIDTIFGTSFLVISPEKFQELKLEQYVKQDKNEAIQDYIKQAFDKTEEERRIGEKDKSGIKTGLLALNPVNQEGVPIYIADYVLSGVGTGVVMGVPAHDERDWAFAKKHNLDIVPVIAPKDNKITVNKQQVEYDHDDPQICTSEHGVMINSDASTTGASNYNGLTSKQGQKKLLQDFAQQMEATTTYKLRDWLISRQRYWGAPIPVIYDPEGKPHLIKDEALPWKLPQDVDFKPTGESPLKSSQEFLERTQQYAANNFADLITDHSWDKNGRGWLPEYDTMDTFVDSSWYYLRYTDARNQQTFARRERLDRFMPVDFYLIGPEHIVLHLLYSRFFTKFLRDQGYLDLPSGEPFTKMRHQGMILGPDNKKMSKSKGNVINPDEIVKKYGADTLRVYEMFMGPLSADKPWDDRAVQGVGRFLNKMYRLCSETIATGKQNLPLQSVERVERKLHATIKKVGYDIPQLKFNTAIAAMMELSNTWQAEKIDHEKQPVLCWSDLITVILILAPFAPFMAEELWHQAGHQDSVHTQDWPQFDPDLAQAELVVIPVQVNGKIRGELHIEAAQLDELTKKEAVAQAKQLDSVKKWLVDESGQQLSKLQKEIYVPGQIVSLVK